ncbi:MAG TPA: transporter substrate-binding domain-containing protein [Anaerolineae bacterium]|nr:transporter substrate-binding domain-containing protein [Anaerolineae bacterium]HQK13581.1 transporter substrate-binding domain-containing protein [Anaerolineae bacterium]
MRRFWLLLLLVTLLSGCSEVEDLLGLVVQPKEEATLPSAYIAPTPEATFPAEMTTMARILARGEMVVGVRYDLEPFSYITANSELAGLEIDLAHELARRWLGNPDAVRFRQVRSDSALQHLANGTVDIVLAGVIHMQELEAQADFSPAYFMDGIAYLTFPDVGIQDLAGLQNRKIGVVSWTGSRAAIAATLPVSPTFVAYDNFFDAIEALRTRQIDVYGDMRHRLERARRLVTGSVVALQTTSEPVALAYRQNDPFFANLVTFTFQDMTADGTLDALYGRWLPGVSPPRPKLLSGSAPTPAPAETPQQLSSLDVLARIRGRGKLALGYFVDRWPYSANRADGVPTGFEVRLVERIAERWLGSRQAINFVPVTEADGLKKLLEGEVDMLVGNWLQTREIELQADFSVEILDDGVSIFSLAAAPVSDLAALNGRAVGVLAGSEGERALPGIAQAAGVGISTVRYPDVETALAGLNRGEVAAIVSERRAWLQIQFTQPGYVVTDQRYTHRPVAIILPQGDSNYRDLVDLTLAALQADGTYQELYSLWFDDPVPTLTVWPGHPAVPLVIMQ